MTLDQSLSTSLEINTDFADEIREPVINVVKRCYICKQNKGLTDFGMLKSSKDGHRFECKECKSAQGSKYRAENKEKISAWHKGNYELRKDAIDARNKAYYEQNKERVIERTKKYRLDRPEWSASYQTEYYKPNKARRDALGRIWRKSNPDKMAALRKRTIESRKRRDPEGYRALLQYHGALRRARKRKAVGKYTLADVRELMRLQKGQCVACRASILKKYHIDHVVALANGGQNHKLNLQLLCPTCNNSKHVKDPVEFMQSRGYLL